MNLVSARRPGSVRVNATFAKAFARTAPYWPGIAASLGVSFKAHLPNRSKTIDHIGTIDRAMGAA
jgi:hypothetical protein